ncbi:MAG: ArnT family glycosyltransferase, partial [Haloarculaceae archaeon]
YVLVLAFATCGFGIWYRVPNFGGPDEYSRLMQPLKVAGRVGADPGLDSLVAGVTDGRALGATFYLYGAVLAPVFLAVVVTGQVGDFLALGSIQSRWTLWHWTATVVLGRLVNVALGVGCVYLTYRLGTELRDRFAGRLAALFLALSVGFVSQAHLVGEDVPMLFFLLLSVAVAHRYVETGRTRTFLLGSVAGGLAIAFKLTGGVGAILLGIAHVDRARRQENTLDALLRPTVLASGLVVGFLTVYIGIPSALVGGPTELIVRVSSTLGSKTGRSGGLTAPIWYWVARGYVAGLGLPLTVATAVGVVGTAVGWVRKPDWSAHPLAVLLVGSVVVPLAVFARWEFVRIRHLVPTYPALLILLGTATARWWDRDRAQRGLKVALAVVLVTTGAFVAAAEAQYVTDPRDDATAWIASNTDDSATVEVYENSIADVGVPHGRETSHYPFRENAAANTSTLVLNESAYTEWMLALPERRPEYVQLTGTELSYLDPRDPRSEQFPTRRRHIRRLLAGEYDYRVAVTFGTRPDYADRSLGERLVRAGVYPRVVGVEQVVIVLERTDLGNTTGR